MKLIYRLLIVIHRTLPILLISILPSCKKYLDEKPLRSTVLISSPDDVQRLLDKHDIMNEAATPGLIELVADDYYVTDKNLQSAQFNDRTNYIWDPAAMYEIAWTTPYQKSIYYANLILDQLPEIKLSAGDQQRMDALRGAALFFRAFAFYHLAQLYCKPFDAATKDEPGIVLRNTSVVLDKSYRATVAQTYEKILGDLNEAARLLPEQTLFPTRPSKSAAFGALARVLLAMRNYAEAGRMADSFLLRNHTLMNYNDIDQSASIPFPRFNTETIFYSTMALPQLLSTSYAKIDTVLYQQYASDDLRKQLLFRKNADGSIRFAGSYEGSPNFIPFNGIATDEIILIRAEAAARAGDVTTATNWLNTLMEKRISKDSYTPYTPSSPVEALQLILKERRKELLFRGLRWPDLRRLNLEGANIGLKRIVNGTTYTLPPGDLRWVLLISDKVISISGIAQNPR